MLSRTGDSLFWLARYMERSDFLARTVEAAQRLAALPQAYNETGSEWDSALESSGAVEAYHAKYGTTEPDSVVDFLTFDPDNPSSIRNCLEAARTNARSVRTALTAEMWDAINGAWLELKSFEQAAPVKGEERERLSRFLEFVKQTSLHFDGAVIRTMLRDPSFWFCRLGLHMERADNTARILDVKYHVLLPDTEQVGGSLDYFQWTAILRAVSAVTAYHWVYRENIKPWLVADLLILRPEMPRSLISCYDNIVRSLDSISQAYGRQGPSQRLSHKTLAQLENSSIEAIFQSGLHEFITTFLEDNNQLGSAITEQYLV
ncbi:alpha-E domain-containing protein [Lichenifustis flavocetrariae]|uniref:Alpha-E domain-containing protein n=1 Tax=Lichenifustis flavocetrariae TaxID=2949735 RepID=A0AA41YXW0_9HYPH|nr:alpha-E domain-containing protein [Lichenifustis flavocetrariae]MCW6510574.1 alpha-E domain-containing protein [Lichenifustis flavocetrariae]